MPNVRKKLLRFATARDRTGLSHTTIYQRIATGKFPPSKPVSDDLVAWYASDINAWIDNPIAYRSSVEAAN